ncbi:MAG: hypothetical protein HGB02_07220 [Chlorobiaceae bacterium]|nr:hypothetical protein [Chlorobiaceae bacterium]
MLSDIHSARLFTGKDREYFRLVAVLRLQAISGSDAARIELEQAITTGALSVAAELRQTGRGGKN